MEIQSVKLGPGNTGSFNGVVISAHGSEQVGKHYFLIISSVCLLTCFHHGCSRLRSRYVVVLNQSRDVVELVATFGLN